MTQDEYDELLRRLAASAERQDAQGERLITLAEIANERLGRAEETLRQMKQQLDRTDATHAGISRTLVGIGTTLERFATAQEAQTVVLQQLATTLDRWMERQANGH